LYQFLISLTRKKRIILYDSKVEKNTNQALIFSEIPIVINVIFTKKKATKDT